ncbi:MAG: DinB family protein [Ktedonobacterales bacterium]|nr:DinB family protein [Ktedonobacterales bacterium]
MEYQHEQTLAILDHTPATLQALLGGLPTAWTRAAAGDATWSAYDVVGHLLHGEQTDWLPRVRAILAHGEDQPFSAFDRTAMFTESAGKSLETLLEAFAVARTANLATLRGFALTPEKLALKGTHPSLGVVTLSNLLAAWATHDLNHLGQIVEVMAHQYAAAVGPWKTYLGILNRPILTE